MHRMVVVAATVVGLACRPSEEEVAAKSADSIVAIARADGRVYRGTLGGRQLALMVHECKVYNLEDTPRKGGKRPSVLEPDFYPWPTVCARQSVQADTTWVTVQLGRTGLGAGGCCATGGTYRTRDGRVWEREGKGGAWMKIGADSTQ